MQTKMEYYNPEETMNFDQKHTVLYSFQYENAFAHVVTTIGGNVAGGGVMKTQFDTGLTVPVNHELTKKYVTFYDDVDKDLPYREVGNIIFYYPNGETIEIDLEDCTNYLTGVQIVDYKP